jgi:hypothetical protein
MTTLPSPCFDRNSEISDAGEDSANAGASKPKNKQSTMANRGFIEFASPHQQMSVSLFRTQPAPRLIRGAGWVFTY